MIAPSEPRYVELGGRTVRQALALLADIYTWQLSLAVVDVGAVEAGAGPLAAQLATFTTALVGEAVS